MIIRVKEDTEHDSTRMVTADNSIGDVDIHHHGRKERRGKRGNANYAAALYTHCSKNYINGRSVKPLSIIDVKPLAAASERKIFHNEMEGRRSSARPVPTVKHPGSTGEDNPSVESWGLAMAEMSSAGRRFPSEPRPTSSVIVFLSHVHSPRHFHPSVAFFSSMTMEVTSIYWMLLVYPSDFHFMSPRERQLLE